MARSVCVKCDNNRETHLGSKRIICRESQGKGHIFNGKWMGHPERHHAVLVFHTDTVVLGCAVPSIPTCVSNTTTPPQPLETPPPSFILFFLISSMLSHDS